MAWRVGSVTVLPQTKMVASWELAKMYVGGCSACLNSSTQEQRGDHSKFKTNLVSLQVTGLTELAAKRPFLK